MTLSVCASEYNVCKESRPLIYQAWRQHRTCTELANETERDHSSYWCFTKLSNVLMELWNLCEKVDIKWGDSDSQCAFKYHEWQRELVILRYNVKTYLNWLYIV